MPRRLRPRGRARRLPSAARPPRVTPRPSATGAAPRCSACTPCGAARRAATRPTVAGGDRHGPPGVVGRSSKRGVPPQRGTHGKRWSPSCASGGPVPREGGGADAQARHRAQGKLTARERLEPSARPRHALPRTLAAGGLGRLRRRRARRGSGHRRGPCGWPRGTRRRQRRDRQGRDVLPAHREEAPARPSRRAREPVAMHLPGGLGRRVSATASRGLPGS